MRLIVQKKHRKLSSQKARFFRRLQQAELDLERRLQAQEEDWKRVPEEQRRVMLMYDLASVRDATAFVIVTAQEELIAESRRPVFLPALANLRNAGIAQFNKSVSKRFFEVADADLLRLRDDLVTIWSAETLRSRSEIAHEAMGRWLRWKPNQNDLKWKRHRYAEPYLPFFPSLEFGSILLDTRNLHAQMTQAVLERIENMRICGNPDCVNPYFLARRSDQKY